ncbi:MAG: hypothetical protein WC935_07170 [Thermoleophilia bacterium]
MKPYVYPPSCLDRLQDERVDLAVCRLAVMVAVPYRNMTVSARTETVFETIALTDAFQFVVRRDDVDTSMRGCARQFEPAETLTGITIPTNARGERMGILLDLSGTIPAERYRTISVNG